jgi:hypothetical protein
MPAYSYLLPAASKVAWKKYFPKPPHQLPELLLLFRLVDLTADKRSGKRAGCDAYACALSAVAALMPDNTAGCPAQKTSDYSAFGNSCLIAFAAVTKHNNDAEKSK